MDPTSAEFFQPTQTQRPPGAQLSIRFETRPVEHPGRSLEAGTPKYDNVDFIYIRNPGSKDEFCKKASQITDPWQKQVYTHWKSTQEQPSDGTPVEMVPWLDPALIMELKAIGIKSLEHLANISDMIITKGQILGLGELRKKAQAYIKAATDGAVVIRLETELADRDRKITDLQNQIMEIGAKFDAMNKTERPVLSVKKG